MSSIFPQTQASGQVTGRVLISGGMIGAVVCLMGRRAYPLAVVLGGVGVSVGTWLHTKLYLDDPEAQKQYLKAFHTQKLSLSLKGGLKGFKTYLFSNGGSSSIQNILKFAQPSDLAKALNAEISQHGNNDGSQQQTGDLFSILLQLYEVGHLAELVEVGAISTAFLKQRFESEVGFWRSKATSAGRNGGGFSHIWLRFESTRQPLTLVLQNDTLRPTVNLGLLRDCFIEEYDWVDENGCLVPRGLSVEDEWTSSAVPTAGGAGGSSPFPPSGRDSESLQPGGDVGVWKAILSYHRFTTQELSIRPAMLQAIVETCPYGRDPTVRMAHRHTQGTILLVKHGLLSKGYVERRLTAELQHHHQLSVGSLAEYQAGCEIKELLRLKIVSSDNLSIKMLFKAGIPIILSTSWGSGIFGRDSSSLNSQNNIIEFISEWGSTMQDFPHLVPEDLRYAMVLSWQAYCDEERRIEQSYYERREDQKKEDKRFQKEKVAALAAGRLNPDDDPKAENKKAKKPRVTAADLAKELTKAKEAAHVRWCESLRMRDFGGRPFNRTRDCLQM